MSDSRSTKQARIECRAEAYLDCINGIHGSVLLQEDAKLARYNLYCLSEGFILLCPQRRLLPCSAAGRSWAGGIHSCAKNSQFRGPEVYISILTRMLSCAHSYSSTGSALGWAMAATASDAPPKGLVSRAARLATGGGIEAIAAIKVTASDLCRRRSRLCRVRGCRRLKIWSCAGGWSLKR